MCVSGVLILPYVHVPTGVYSHLLAYLRSLEYNAGKVIHSRLSPFSQRPTANGTDFFGPPTSKNLAMGECLVSRLCLIVLTAPSDLASPDPY